MRPTSDPRLVADQMLMADHILCAFSRGAMPMHPAGYQELARWATESFESLDSAVLPSLRDAAPPELQEIVENVLHERRVPFWAAGDLSDPGSLAECLLLIRRCRGRKAA